MQSVCPAIVSNGLFPNSDAVMMMMRWGGQTVRRWRKERNESSANISTIYNSFLSLWMVIKALFCVLKHILILSLPYMHHQHHFHSTIHTQLKRNRTVCPIVCRSSTSQHLIPFAMNGKTGDEIFLFYFFSGGKSKRSKRRRKEKYICGYSVIITKSRSYFLWSFLSRILLHYIISLYD